MRRRAFPKIAGFLCFGALFLPLVTHAQVAVKVNSVDVSLVGSPDFGSSLKLKGSKPTFTPKEWLQAQVEMEFAAKDNKENYIDDVEIAFFVLLKGGGEKKNIMVTSTQTFSNVRLGENVRATAYLSPPALERLTQSTRPSTNLIEGIAVEIRHAGKEIGGDQKGMPNAASRPWRQATSDAEMLPRNRTAFRDLFYDAYLQPEE